MNNSQPTIWAKLIPLNPNHQPISFSFQSNEPQASPEWKIYQTSPERNTFIFNLSTPYLQVEDTQLETNQEQRLFGGERIVFSPATSFDYVFCFTHSQPQNDLKRENNQESSSLTSSQQDKLVRIQNDIQEELACAICIETISSCVTLSPCLHNFCHDCLNDYLKRSTDCPLCRKKIKSANKNPFLHRIVGLALEAVKIFPSNADSIEEEKAVPAKKDAAIKKPPSNSIQEKGIYIGTYVNGKKEGQGEMTYEDGSVYQGIFSFNLI